jgi:lipopolysaccharide transport system permease protein
MEAETDAPVHVIRPRNSLARLGLFELFEHRHLLKFFVLRSIRGRYRPTMLGYGWIIGRPVLLCLVYVLVVGSLFNVNSEPIPFPVFVFLGVSAYLFFAGGVMDTTGSLINNAGTMSKVYYPRLIAPLSAILVNLLDFIAALSVVAVLMLVYGVAPSPNIIYLPLFILGFALVTLALGLILAARTVNVRDVMLIMPVMMRVLIYTMPCVYPVTLVPPEYQAVYFLNPLAAFLQGLRWSLLGELAPPAWSIAIGTAVVVAGLTYGLYSFNRVERNMVDTL